MADFDFEANYAPSRSADPYPTLPPSVMDAFLAQRKKDMMADAFAKESANAEAQYKNREMLGLPPVKRVVVDPRYQERLPEITASQAAPLPPNVGSGAASAPPPVVTAAKPDVVRNKTMPAANTSVAASKPSGVEQEAQSKSALNDLMAQLAAHRQIDPEEQRRQMWLNFFSGMAKSQSPTLIGSVADGSSTLGPTMQAQTNARMAAEEKSLEDQIKMAQYEQDYGLKERAVGADEMRARAFADRPVGGGNSINNQMKFATKALQHEKAAAMESDPAKKQEYLEQAAYYRQQEKAARGGAGEGVSAAGNVVGGYDAQGNFSKTGG